MRAAPADPCLLARTGLHGSLACDPAGRSLFHTQCFTFILCLPAGLPVSTHHPACGVDPGLPPASPSHLGIWEAEAPGDRGHFLSSYWDQGRKLNVRFQLSAVLQGKGIIVLLPSVSLSPTLNSSPLPVHLSPPDPLPTLPSHPGRSRCLIGLAQAGESEGWVDCAFGSRLILVSGLYLFSFLLPLSAAGTGTAWLAILNRPPTSPTFPLRCPVSGLPLGSAGVEGGEPASREGGGGYRCPGGPCPGRAVTQTPLPCR